METVFINQDYKILKKKNGSYIFKHILKNKETGELKVIHDFSCLDIKEFLDCIKGKVSDSNYEYVKSQKTNSDHAFGIFAEGFIYPDQCTYTIQGEEMNILDMMVQSKLVDDSDIAYKTMRDGKVQVDGRVINNMFYKLTKGEVIQVNGMFKVKILTER